MTAKKIVNLGILFVLGMLIANVGFSAGFEQEVMWSGKNAGMASAVTSTVEGPEALYFNPAGLLSTTEEDSKNEMSFNLSYIRSQLKAPVTTPNQSETSRDGNDFLASVFYSRQLTKDFAFGIGVFPSGGLAVEYKNYDLGLGVSGAPKADLKIIEFSSGVAYRPISDLTFGLAYRITYAMGSLTTLDPTNFTVVEFKDLEGWDFLSFRGGVQYKKESWGTGLSFRTPITLKAKGDFEIRTPFGTATDNNSSIRTTFPLMVSLGGYFKPIANLTLLLNYDFLNYQENDELEVETNNAELPVTGGAELPNQTLKWINGHVVRLGAQYVIDQLCLRAGYVFSTAITNKDTMTPTTEPPAAGHSFTLGGGYKFTDRLQADVALLYGFGKKDINSRTALSGEYEVSELAVHSGLTWKF